MASTMYSKVNELQGKLSEFRVIGKNSTNPNWPIIKEIIMLFADVLSIVAKDLPERLKWLSSVFMLVSQMLAVISQSLPLSIEDCSSKLTS
jgi:hypothetical protein